jgi:hypothetical protein
MRRATYALFSSDPATFLSFCLFGKLRNALMGAKFAEEQKLLDNVMAVLGSISRNELEAVFDEWLA